MMPNQMNRAQLMQWINMVSFAVVDITEYLDTHPHDMEAIKYFHHFSDLRRTALRMYAEKFGPLTLDTVTPENDWQWAMQPWPWEGGDC